uniref:Semaphorin 3C n=1 Tax=Pavo cristatus TaxID=9049 RepID=A0A8C9FXK6_PAVCR
MAFLALHVVIGIFIYFSSVKGSSQPQARVFLTFNELQETKTSEYHRISHSPLDYRILLMDEDQDRIYVGSKDHILSLNINNISQDPLSILWPASANKVEECKMAGKDPTHGCGNFVRVIQSYNRTHLYVCGSGAFSPVCVYVNRGRRSEEQIFKIDSKCESGKGRCSFNPNVNTVSVMINEELFSGMYIDFMGTDAAIFRSLTKRNAVRTDQHNSKWLSEPIFVDAHVIPDGTDPNDAKIYFFFKERLTDNSGSTKQIHSMIARICPNDTGGQRSLVNKWTTFLKARLVCSVMDEDGTETYFDELEDVFLLETDNPRTTLVYGIFTTSSIAKHYCACFVQCPGGAFTPNMRTTKEFPDDVVTFIRNHPLMYNPIYPIHKRPLIIRIGTDYKYTKIAVDRVNAADGRYHVLFLGTDQGTVQKVVVLPTNFSASGELILEELEVFQVWLAPTFTLPMCVFAQTLCSKRLCECAYCQLDTHPKSKIKCLNEECSAICPVINLLHLQKEDRWDGRNLDSKPHFWASVQGPFYPKPSKSQYHNYSSCSLCGQCGSVAVSLSKRGE